MLVFACTADQFWLKATYHLGDCGRAVTRVSPPTAVTPLFFVTQRDFFIGTKLGRRTPGFRRTGLATRETRAAYMRCSASRMCKLQGSSASCLDGSFDSLPRVNVPGTRTAHTRSGNERRTVVPSPASLFLGGERGLVFLFFLASQANPRVTIFHRQFTDRRVQRILVRARINLLTKWLKTDGCENETTSPSSFVAT